jgi:Zn-finger protein
MEHLLQQKKQRKPLFAGNIVYQCKQCHTFVEGKNEEEAKKILQEVSAICKGKPKEIEEVKNNYILSVELSKKDIKLSIEEE